MDNKQWEEVIESFAERRDHIGELLEKLGKAYIPGRSHRHDQLLTQLVQNQQALMHITEILVHNQKIIGDTLNLTNTGIDSGWNNSYSNQ